MSNDLVAAELLGLLLRGQAAAAIAVAGVLAIRVPARRMFGPEVAFRLWTGPPLAAFAALITPLLPARVAAVAPAGSVATGPAISAQAWFLIWGLGILAAATLMAFAQLRFLRQARRGLSGPAIVGVVCPKLVMPPDDGRYSGGERAMIRAHERAHMDRGDPKGRAVVAVLQCLSWFNPMVHVAAWVSRLDQELACDASVVRRHPRQRGLYARALLKTQLASAPLPFGCHWAGAHPLELRIGLLKAPRRGESMLGGAFVGLVVLAGALTIWATQPPAPQLPRFDPTARRADPGPRGYGRIVHNDGPPALALLAPGAFVDRRP